jgi:demethoxyubiquinone hydroxylase (CLK1/Coq7/Cat5 family)
MWDQEKEHLKKFEELIPQTRTRPTAMLPIWNIAGFVLGEYSRAKYQDTNHLEHSRSLHP